MAVRLRLTLSVAVATVCVVILAGCVSWWGLNTALTSATDTRLVDRAGVLGHELIHEIPAVSLQSPSPLSITALSPHVLGPQGIDVIEVYDAGGSVVAAVSSVASPSSLLSPSQIASARHHPQLLTLKVAGYGPGLRVYVTPLGHAGGLLVVGGSLGSEATDLTEGAGAIVVGGAFIVAITVLGSWILGGAALAPVERLRRQASTLAASGGGLLEVPATGDEISALAMTMNEALGRLREALAQQRAFVSDAGHELRTPLATLSAELELALRPKRTQPELIDALSHAQEETARLVRLSEDLLMLAHSDEGQLTLAREEVVLHQCIATAADACRAMAREHDVTFALDVPTDLIVECDRDRVVQCVVNLITNAVRYSKEGTAVEVSARSGEEAVTIAVADRGEGFPDDFVGHAFERFRRSDHARDRVAGGHGLGLAIVATIMEAHGGRATARNREGGGAVVELELPHTVSEEHDGA